MKVYNAPVRLEGALQNYEVELKKVNPKDVMSDCYLVGKHKFKKISIMIDRDIGIYMLKFDKIQIFYGKEESLLSVLNKIEEMRIRTSRNPYNNNLRVVKSFSNDIIKINELEKEYLGG